MEQKRERNTGGKRACESMVCAAAVLACVLLGLFFLVKGKMPEIREMDVLEPDFAGSRAERIAGNAQGLLVRVDSQGSSGSGVIFEVTETDLRVVTAAHVLRDWTDVRLTFCDGFTVMCADVRVVQDADIAFLDIPLRQLRGSSTEQYRRAVTDKERYDALSAWDTVFCMGAQQEDGQSGVYEGYLEENWIYVEDFAQYMMLANCQVTPGMSGGGLFDERGNLIGIVCGGNEQGELATVPLHMVWAKYEELYQQEF